MTTILLAVFAALHAAEEPPNLLSNPGFEVVEDQGWAREWVIWPAPPAERGAVAVDTQQAHSGSHSLRLRHSSPGSYDRAQQTLTVEPNQRYFFSVWMKGEDIKPGGGSQGARLYVEGLGGQDHASEAMFGTFDWRQLTVGPIDSVNGGGITVMCYLHLASGSVWFDDVVALKVTSEWTKRQQVAKAQKRVEVELDRAESAAWQAEDQAALREVRDIRNRLAEADLPERLDARRGPPYFPLHAEVFKVMARLNTRRLAGQGPLMLWTADPFAQLPALGLVPRRWQATLRAMSGTGERDQAVLNLCNIGDSPMHLRVKWSGFPGKQSPIVTLRQAIHVQSRLGQLIADPLPRLQSDPRHGGIFEMDVVPGLFRQLWLDVSTANAAPGDYRGTLKLSATGLREVTVPVAVRVLPVAFPKQTPIATWNYSYQHWALIKDRWPQALADLQAHHINSYCWPPDTLPWPRFDAEGKLQFLDWSIFDKAVSSHGPVQWLLLWPGFEWADRLRLVQDLEPGSELWEERLVAWFRALISGLKDRGFGYDRIAWYLADEPCNRARADAVLLAGRALRKADPQALIVENPYSAATQELLDLMAPVVDIWCPSLPWAKNDLLKFFQRKSKILWSYQVLSRDADPFAAYRLSFWQCWQNGMTGQGFWDYADCKGDNWGEEIGGDAGYAVVYGGDLEELIPSRRWEAWREGTEDYTYLWLLQQRAGRSPVRDAQVAKLLEKPTPETLQTLRNRVLGELAKLPSAPPAASSRSWKPHREPIPEQRSTAGQ